MPLTTEDVEATLNELRSNLIGASDAGIKTELYSVIKEFLHDTNAWIEHIELLVENSVQSYNLVPRTGGQVIRLVGVWDGFRFPVNASMPTFSMLNVHTPVDVTSVAQAVTDRSRQASTPWLVVVAKNIDLPNTRQNIPICPEFVLKVYSMYIVDGVLGRMLSQPSKSWSNTALGIYHLKRFRDGISIARDSAWNQNVVGGQRWAFPRNFATSSQRSGISTAYPSETM